MGERTVRIREVRGFDPLQVFRIVCGCKSVNHFFSAPLLFTKSRSVLIIITQRTKSCKGENPNEQRPAEKMRAKRKSPETIDVSELFLGPSDWI